MTSKPSSSWSFEEQEQKAEVQAEQYHVGQGLPEPPPLPFTQEQVTGLAQLERRLEIVF